MNYNLHSLGNTRILEIEPPNPTLANTKFQLMIKDLKGKLLYLWEGISLPHKLKVENLEAGKYVLTLIGGGHFFSELISA